MDAKVIQTAREAGAHARRAGDDRASCLWVEGPARDAWLQAYDSAPDLLKVFSGGGPLLGQHIEP